MAAKVPAHLQSGKWKKASTRAVIGRKQEEIMGKAQTPSFVLKSCQRSYQ